MNKCGDCGRHVKPDAKRCACGWVTPTGEDAQQAALVTKCERCRDVTAYLVPYRGVMCCAKCYSRDLHTDDYTDADRWRARLIRGNPDWQKREDETSKDYAIRMLGNMPANGRALIGGDNA